MENINTSAEYSNTVIGKICSQGHITMMLALTLVLAYCAGSAVSQTCKNAGCIRQDGFTFIYIRDGDYVNITAYVRTPDNTWAAVGISEDKMMVSMNYMTLYHDSCMVCCIYSLTQILQLEQDLLMVHSISLKTG